MKRLKKVLEGKKNSLEEKALWHQKSLRIVDWEEWKITGEMMESGGPACRSREIGHFCP